VTDLVKRSAGQVPAAAGPVTQEIWIDQYLEQKQGDVARYWHILVKRKRLVAAVAFVVLAAGTVYTLTAPRIYSSRVSLQIEPEQNVLGYQEAYAAAASDPTYLRTQSQVLRSEVLATRVVNRLKLATDPSKTVSTARWFSSQIVVTPVEGTQVLSVSFRSEDPKFAATAINTLADEYVNYGFASKRETTTLARNYVEEELAKAELRLQQSERDLVNYGRARGILLPTQDNNSITQKLVDLNGELTKADTQLLANNYEALKETTVENFPERLKTPVMIALDRNRAELEQNLDIPHIGRRHIAHRILGIFALAAAPEAHRDHPPFRREPRRQILEIARIPCQAWHAQDRRALRTTWIVAIVQPQAIGRLEKTLAPRRRGARCKRVARCCVSAHTVGCCHGSHCGTARGP